VVKFVVNVVVAVAEIIVAAVGVIVVAFLVVKIVVMVIVVEASWSLSCYSRHFKSRSCGRLRKKSLS
jgi:hypothetical protein